MQHLQGKNFQNNIWKWWVIHKPKTQKLIYLCAILMGHLLFTNNILYIDLLHSCKIRKLTHLPSSKHLKLLNSVIILAGQLFIFVFLLIKSDVSKKWKDPDLWEWHIDRMINGDMTGTQFFVMNHTINIKIHGQQSGTENSVKQWRNYTVITTLDWF
jgi:hypothetical protein